MDGKAVPWKKNPPFPSHSLVLVTASLSVRDQARVLAGEASFWVVALLPVALVSLHFFLYRQAKALTLFF